MSKRFCLSGVNFKTLSVAKISENWAIAFNVKIFATKFVEEIESRIPQSKFCNGLRSNNFGRD